MSGLEWVRGRVYVRRSIDGGVLGLSLTSQQEGPVEVRLEVPIGGERTIWEAQNAVYAERFLRELHATIGAVLDLSFGGRSS